MTKLNGTFAALALLAVSVSPQQARAEPVTVLMNGGKFKTYESGVVPEGERHLMPYWRFADLMLIDVMKLTNEYKKTVGKNPQQASAYLSMRYMASVAFCMAAREIGPLNLPSYSERIDCSLYSDAEMDALVSDSIR